MGTFGSLRSLQFDLKTLGTLVCLPNVYLQQLSTDRALPYGRNPSRIVIQRP